MKIGEITKEANISVAVIRGDTSVNLSTTVLAVGGETLYVEPFMHNGACISFLAPDLRLEMIVSGMGDVPYYWKGISIVKEKYDNQVCHAIRCNVDGVRLNRRNSFRVFIGEKGSILEVPGEGQVNVTIKDVSAGGISFVTQGADAPEFKPGAHVHIKYEDREARFTIDVISRVVRRDEVENNYVYGCTFTRVYPQMSRYVAAKQIRNRNKNIGLKR